MADEEGPQRACSCKPWQEVEFDLSSLNYSGFIKFFFDRPEVPEKETFELFDGKHLGVDRTVHSNPAATLQNVTTMCRRFVELTTTFSAGQIDQGLWAMFGHKDCTRELFNREVDLPTRLACIEAMHIPFRDYVSQQADPQGGFYFMWWDMVLHELRVAPRQYRYCAPLNRDERSMINAIFEVLKNILALPHRGCQNAALHGLGHLYHPKAASVIEQYLAEHRGEMSAMHVGWIEACMENMIQ